VILATQEPVQANCTRNFVLSRLLVCMHGYKIYYYRDGADQRVSFVLGGDSHIFTPGVTIYLLANPYPKG
jgi:hypothetical protein